MSAHTTIDLVNQIFSEPPPLTLEVDYPMTAADAGRVNRYCATCVALGIPALRIDNGSKVTVYAFDHLKETPNV